MDLAKFDSEMGELRLDSTLLVANISVQKSNLQNLESTRVAGIFGTDGRKNEL